MGRPLRLSPPATVSALARLRRQNTTLRRCSSPKAATSHRFPLVHLPSISSPLSPAPPPAYLPLHLHNKFFRRGKLSTPTRRMRSPNPTLSPIILLRSPNRPQLRRRATLQAQPLVDFQGSQHCGTKFRFFPSLAVSISVAHIFFDFLLVVSMQLQCTFRETDSGNPSAATGVPRNGVGIEIRSQVPSIPPAPFFQAFHGMGGQIPFYFHLPT